MTGRNGFRPLRSEPPKGAGAHFSRGEGICGAALALLLVLALLTGVIRFFATSAGEMEAAMRRFAPSAATGLPEADYPAMARHIADYLAGRKDDFQYTVRLSEGRDAPCFHAYEMIHMADCRRLIRLDGILCLVSLAGAIALLGGMLIFRRRVKPGDPADLRSVIAGAERGLWALSVIAAALTLWAVINFDGLFITFHRAAFRNDLWLLDPRTDLLIRLMPEQLFIHLGLKGLGVFAVGLAGLVMGLEGMKRRSA